MMNFEEVIDGLLKDAELSEKYTQGEIEAIKVAKRTYQLAQLREMKDEYKVFHWVMTEYEKAKFKEYVTEKEKELNVDTVEIDGEEYHPRLQALTIELLANLLIKAENRIAKLEKLVAEQAKE